MTNHSDQKSGRGSEKEAGGDEGRSSLLDALLRRAGKVAGGTLDLAMDVALDVTTLSAVLGDSWLRDLLSNAASPERLEAMADAGRFLRDARETAGLTIEELAERLELGDKEVLAGVEKGEALLPLEIMLRAASLLARHDPIPFLIKFFRSYNPQLEATLEQWGVMALPKNYERERRFTNLYRQHDFLRELSDEEHQRFIEYMDASTRLVVEVMEREGAARAGGTSRRKSTAQSRRKNGAKKPSAKTSDKPAAEPVKTPGASRDTKPRRKSAPRKRPVVRKVKPRSNER